MADLPFVKVSDLQNMIYQRLQTMQQTLYPEQNRGYGLVPQAVNAVHDETAPPVIPSIDTEILKYRVEEISQLLAVIDQLQGP